MECTEFKRKTAIATGAASGMALLFMQKMAKGGVNVVMVDINAEAVETAAEVIRQDGCRRAFNLSGNQAFCLAG